MPPVIARDDRRHHAQREEIQRRTPGPPRRAMPSVIAAGQPDRGNPPYIGWHRLCSSGGAKTNLGCLAMSRVMITVAPTGAFPTKEHNPAVPMTPREIADDVVACWTAGAAIAHLHMRDENGRGTMDKARFAETVARIRDRCDIVLNLTTSGDLDATDETRMAHIIELKPELASYDAGTMNWGHSTLFVNHPRFLETLGRTMVENGIRPEIEVFDAGMYYNAAYYMKQGVIKAPGYFQFVLGAPGGTAATVENLVYLKSLLPPDAVWSAFGIGASHLPILFATIALGGHVRVGMEDNVFYAKGRLATSNAEFVERAVRLVHEANQDVATPSDARTILNLH
ncbi:3-keto-5-aminohexanoate cleavage protein [Azospirillum sp. A39]|uniref:3-keto-5-aminohexanoate cleavage protein n=1 Tax=Azospirillum sp. A39 TaxID=3462279 RepID=UPI0040461737